MVRTQRIIMAAALIAVVFAGCMPSGDDDGGVVTVSGAGGVSAGGAGGVSAGGAMGAGGVASRQEDLTADDDDDGLDLAAERALGTDPAVADSDGDGYSDGDEAHAGTTPTDPESVIYHGGWPYNRHKDEIEGPDWDSEPSLGTMMPRYRARDQYGDLFDLYDLYGLGRPVVIDVATWFCEPCKAMAQFFTDGDEAVFEEFPWWRPEFAPVREMIENDELFWITILYSGGTPVTQEDVTRWHDTWPSDKIIVLADSDNQLSDYLSVRAMPRIDILDQDLVFTVYYPQGPVRGMRTLVGLE